MYDIGLQLLGVRDDSKLMYALCSITQTDATSHNRAKRDCGLQCKLETVSIAEPLQNRQHVQNP